MGTQGLTVRITEVGPREGFQSESRTIPTEEKVRFIDSLARTGISEIQVTSFSHPKLLPQLADAEAVMAQIERPPGVGFSVLVPNLRGAERASQVAADKWGVMLSVSNSHSLANSNRTTAEALVQVAGIVRLAREVGVEVDGGMGTALGCPFEGRIPLKRIEYVVDSYLDLGVRDLIVADTAGMADPLHVYDTMAALLDRYPNVRFKLHLHDTRGMGLANVVAGLRSGVTAFDSSVAGLGGCPFIPGAAGNIATEDLVHMLELMACKTSIDLTSLVSVARTVEDMMGHRADSSLVRAGASDELHDLAKVRVAAVNQTRSRH